MDLSVYPVIRIVYGEAHENSEACIFYTGLQEEFPGGANAVKAVVSGEACNEVCFPLPILDWEQTKFCLTLFLPEDAFTISRIFVEYEGQTILEIKKADLEQYIAALEGCEYGSNAGRFHALTEQPSIYLNDFFSGSVRAGLPQVVENIKREELLKRFSFDHQTLFRVVILFYFVLLTVQSGGREKMPSGYPRRQIVAAWSALAVGGVLVWLGISLNYGMYYLIRHFGDLSLEKLFFHLNTPLKGTDMSSFSGVFYNIGWIGAGVLAWLLRDLLLLWDRWVKRGYTVWLICLGVVLTAYPLMVGYVHFDYPSYYRLTHEKSELYETFYRDGREVALSFPAKKRNLIYICLESMETTFAGREAGGAMESDLVPELSNLALEYVDFSASDVLNGAHTVTGANYTMGSLVAQTAGVPVSGGPIEGGEVNEWESETDCLLPGVWTIGDILAAENYRQVFMIGSDGGFAGRAVYFKKHGNYRVKDYNTALDEGLIPKDYQVWWGYEDEKLIEFAKSEILSLAQSPEPFNFTMLTVDTHFTGGYVCELCDSVYDAQYSNVLACASRQIGAFVEWIMQQDFYEDTTIVIAGDHPTMDYDYIISSGAGDYDRKTFFVIINPGENCAGAERERQYTILDVYPTTLAALGVGIEGNRLGLGVNLFSDVPTLYEEYGGEYLLEELLKYSDFYTKHLLYK